MFLGSINKSDLSIKEEEEKKVDVMPRFSAVSFILSLFIMGIIVVIHLVDDARNAMIIGYSLGIFSIVFLLPIALLLGVFAVYSWYNYVKEQVVHERKLMEELDLVNVRARRDQNAILRLMDELTEFSNGDLTVEAQVTEDFTGAIADSVNFVIESMRELVGTINYTAAQVTNASKGTRTLSTQMKNSVQKQQEQVVDLSVIISEIVGSLDRVSASTTDSAEIARQSVQIARNGSLKVQDTIGGMNVIREHIQDTSKRIKRLGESSQEIGNIIEIIKSIAEQTSVLALNAAIQASSAGEAGKGFAVVADEVQKLAERSSNATRRIESIVKTIQNDTNEAVASMEKSTKEVVSGADIAEEAGGALTQIEEVSSSLANLIDRVSGSARQLSGRAQSLNSGMQKINEIADAASENVDRTNESIENLNKLAQDLERSISHFTLPENY